MDAILGPNPCRSRCKICGQTARIWLHQVHLIGIKLGKLVEFMARLCGKNRWRHYHIIGEFSGSENWCQCPSVRMWRYFQNFSFVSHMPMVYCFVSVEETFSNLNCLKTARIRQQKSRRWRQSNQSGKLDIRHAIIDK